MKPAPLSVDPHRHCLHYTSPVSRWDEALPLGNGLMGLLVWGDGHPLNLSVDRSDLWDNRDDPGVFHPDFNWKTLRRLVDRRDVKRIVSIFEKNRKTIAYPTKLPCGRITLDFARGNAGPFASHLDFATAISRTRIGKLEVTAYVHAQSPLVVVRVRNGKPRVGFLSPFDRSRAVSPSDGTLAAGQIRSLGYPALKKGRTRGGIEYIVQECAEGMSYTVAWTNLRVRGEWVLYATVQQAYNGSDPLPLAIGVLEDAKATGPNALERTHVAWWRNYWKLANIRLPDTRIEHLWYAEMYKLASTARRGTPPISLQGVWTADEMALPPWRGDYHHDLNTQMSYWPALTANRVEQSRAFAEWLLELLPRYRDFARKFYGAPGANIPCSHGLNGAIVRGWAPYVYSRSNAAWVAQQVWWHYRYTMDKGFLRNVGYPFLSEVARFCVSQLTRDRKGIYHVHYSSSPEYFHNWIEAWAKDSTYDLANIRYALEAASAAAKVLGRDSKEAEHWDRVRSRLQPYHLSPTEPKSPAPEGGLAIWQGQRLTESHRHPAQCMPIFPLGDVNIEGSDRDREIIRNTISEIESMGTGFWCGYSFSWYACIGARLREPNRALWGLNNYLDYCASPNTFHLNGDYKSAGASRFHYRPFTLEGNFGAAHAVNEMLLQSWGGRLRLFPAVPEAWGNVAFTNLRAEGAFLVSAWRRDGAFAKAEVQSESGGRLCIEHPHSTRPVKVGQRVFPPGSDIHFVTKPGETYILSLA
jgi:alpha-L-fucosidase 2